MNPLLFARLVPGLLACAGSVQTVQALQGLASTAIQAQRANTAFQVLNGICGVPIRFVGGAVTGAINGALGPAVRLLPGQERGHLENGLLLKVLKKDNVLNVITGPEFGSHVMICVGYVVVGVTVYILIYYFVRYFVRSNKRIAELESSEEAKNLAAQVLKDPAMLEALRLLTEKQKGSQKSSKLTVEGGY